MGNFLVNRVRHFYNKEIEIKRIMSVTTLSNVVTKFLNEYSINTPTKLKIIDAYLTYVFLPESSNLSTVAWWARFPSTLSCQASSPASEASSWESAYAYKSILKTRVNSKGSALKEHLPTLFLHTSFYI